MRRRYRRKRHAKLRCGLPARRRRPLRRDFPVQLLSDRIRQWTPDGVPLGKPLSHEAALAQLQSLQGRTAVFYTALAVIGPTSESVQVDCVPTTVKFRNLPKEKLESVFARRSAVRLRWRSEDRVAGHRTH